jgi:VWFA-related protein
MLNRLWLDGWRKQQGSRTRLGLQMVAVTVLFATCVYGQAPAGPMTPPPGTAVQQAPQIKVRSLLVSTPVTVRDEKGEMVHSLEQADFHVTDNGVPQRITHFDLGGDPISLVVVVETSSRIGPLLPKIRKSGILISQTVMGPTGEGAVVGYDNEVKTLQDFTSDADAMDKTMRELPEGSDGSKLFDAMSQAVEMLIFRPEVSQTELGKRRVMLVIGEAHDSGSEAKLGEVLRRAQLANITIYAVGISGAKADLKRKPDDKEPLKVAPDTIGMPRPPGTADTPTTEAQAREAGTPAQAALTLAIWAVSHAKDAVTSRQLEIAAAATGGEHVSARKDSSLEKVLDEIGGELHSQYTLNYVPTGTGASGYHEIVVNVDRKDLTVRARPGYYLAEPGS